jgi:hypothetical protein
MKTIKITSRMKEISYFAFLNNGINSEYLIQLEICKQLYKRNYKEFVHPWDIPEEIKEESHKINSMLMSMYN